MLNETFNDAEIAYSLINESAPAVGSSVLTEIRPRLSSDKPRSLLQELSDASLDCFILFVDTVKVCFTTARDESIDRTSGMGESHDENGAEQTFSRLQAWYSGRPLDLQPLVDEKDAAGQFDIPIFTNSIGSATHMLYHTAMLLLLAYASVQLENSTLADKTKNTTPMWHAQRVCSIARGSEQVAGFWDPCTIGCISLVAGYMRGRQRNELSAFLSSIRAGGWRILKIPAKLGGERWVQGENLQV